MLETTIAKPLGIWRCVEEPSGTVFRRMEEYKSQFHLWADVETFPQDKQQPRIVWLGESVARGYFFDPYFNPASCLQYAGAALDTPWEVIDLAKTSCKLSELTDLVQNSEVLSPDVLILFAGNNWIGGGQESFTGQEELQIFEAIQKGSPKAVIRKLINHKLRAQIEVLFQNIHRLKREYGTKVIFINPEFNLKDWKSTSIECIPQFPKNNLKTWYELVELCEASLSDGRIEEATSNLAKLQELTSDNPYGYQLQARLHALKGEVNEEIEALRKAREQMVSQVHSYPGVRAYIQEQIRICAELYDVILIDLPEIMYNKIEGAIPDRTFFLDYCHLTTQGIQLVVEAVAEKLFDLLECEQEEKPQMEHPSFEVQAKAHFLAAIHNAHWGQTGEILEHHCRMAMNYHDVSGLMARFVLMVSCGTNWHLNVNYLALMSDPSFSVYFNQISIKPGRELLDWHLVTAILRVLDDNELSEQVSHLRCARMQDSCQGTDLLKPMHWVHYENSLNWDLSARSFYKEIGSTSRFYLEVNDLVNRQITLTHRIPAGEQKHVSVKLNGQEIHLCQSTNQWTKEEIQIKASRWMKGTNLLEVVWPLDIASPSEINHQQAAIDLFYEFMYPVTGEIHQLLVKPDASISLDDRL